MKENEFIFISFIIIIIGLVVMIFVNKYVSIPKLDISEINDSLKYVIVEGRIVSVKESSSGIRFLKVSDNSESITFVIFPGSVEKVKLQELRKGSCIEVVGNVQKYKGSLEIIVKKLLKVFPC